MPKALPILNPKAGGIDVGSENFYVSIGGEAPEMFGTFTSEVYRLRDYLKEQDCNTVAMEATGVYWLYIYSVLEEAGIEVIVVNGRHVRNLPGRKTDVSDCQWLATLHAHGLLRGGFVPPAGIRRLQDFQRLRGDHIIGAASQVQKMQQALERMNIKLHDVISSLTTVSGLKVIRAIVAGERNPVRLLDLCDVQIQKKKANQVIESLRGTWAPEHIFALKQALLAWDFYQDLMKECDVQMEAVLKELAAESKATEEKDENDQNPPSKCTKSRGKNAPEIDNLHQLLVKIAGADATELPGIAEDLFLQLIAETGTDMTKWATDKHFTAWTGNAPGSNQSGKRKGSAKRQRNRTGRLFCTAARSLIKSVDKGLGGFYRRLAARKGGMIAVQALARKLALLYYRTLRYGLKFVEKGLKEYEEKYAESQRRLLVKLARKQGFELVSIAGKELKNAIPA